MRGLRYLDVLLGRGRWVASVVKVPIVIEAVEWVREVLFLVTVFFTS